MSCVYLQGGGSFNGHNEQDNRNPGLLKKMVLLLLLVVGAIAGFAQQVASPYCLKVKVRPTIDNKTVTGATMRLYKGQQEVTRIDSTEEKAVVFLLEKNTDYTIEVTEEGRLARRISFTTDMPDEVPVWPMFRFDVSVELPVQTQVADDFYLDFPIALVSYNEAKDRFEHSKEYTAHIRQKMQEMESESIVVGK
jgi:hypothetical protein